MYSFVMCWPIFFSFLSFIQEPKDESMPSIVGDPVAESTLAYVEEQPYMIRDFKTDFKKDIRIQIRPDVFSGPNRRQKSILEEHNLITFKPLS